MSFDEAIIALKKGKVISHKWLDDPSGGMSMYLEKPYIESCDWFVEEAEDLEKKRIVD